MEDNAWRLSGLDDLERLVMVEDIKNLVARHRSGAAHQDFETQRRVFAADAERDVRRDGFCRRTGIDIFPVAEIFGRHARAAIQDSMVPV